MTADNDSQRLARATARNQVVITLAEWRAQRRGALADAVDAATRACALPQPPQTHRQVSKWWLAEARPYDEVTVGALVAHGSVRLLANDLRFDGLRARWPDGHRVLDAIVEAQPRWLTHGIGQPSALNFVARFAELWSYPDDPRVATLLTSWLVDGALLDLVPGSVMTLLADKIAALGDVRQVPRLQHAAREPRGASARLQQRQIELVRRAMAGLPLASLTASAPTPDDRLDALWREIAARPDDLAPRRVLADALVAAGDTRGELIALQCADALDVHGRERLHRLLNTEWHRWLGDLALVLTRKGTTFERGMLRAVRIGQTSTPRWAWSKIRRHRELALVDSVHANHVAPVDFIEFVRALPGPVRTLGLGSPELVDELYRQRPALAATRVSYDQHTTTVANRYAFPPLAETLQKLAAVMPALEELELAAIWPWQAKPQVRDIAPLLPRMFPALRRIRIAAPILRGIETDPDAAARTATLPYVELYEP